MANTTGERLAELRKAEQEYHFSTPTMVISPDQGIVVVYGNEEVIIDNAGIAANEAIGYGVTAKDSHETIRADINPDLPYFLHSKNEGRYIRFSGTIHEDGYTRSVYVSEVYGGLKIDCTRNGNNVLVKIRSKNIIATRPSGSMEEKLGGLLPADVIRRRRRGH